MKNLNQLFEKNSESAIKFIEFLQKKREKKDKTAEKNRTRQAPQKMLLQKSSKNEKTIVNLFFTTVEKFFKFFSSSLKQFSNTAKQHNINDNLCFNQFSSHSFLKLFRRKKLFITNKLSQSLEKS